MKYFIFLRGNSGAGKSTVAELLANKIGNCAVLCPDHFYHEILKNVDEKDFKKKLVYEAFAPLVEFYMKNELHVILEGLFTRYHSSELLRQFPMLSAKYGYIFKQYFLKTSLDMAISRNKERDYLNIDNQTEWYKDIMPTIDENVEEVLDTEMQKPIQIADLIYKSLNPKS